MGLGFHDFAAAEVLTAANVDGYLMRQTIMTFASTAARDSALSGVLADGMPCYVTANDAHYIYDGSAWQIMSRPMTTGEQLGGVTIGGNVDDTSSGSLTDWLSVSLTVPTWASSATVHTYINGLYEATAASNSYAYRTRIGSQAGSTYATEGQGLSVRFSLAYVDRITSLSTGSQAFTVQTNRTAGTGRFRVDTSSVAKFDVRFYQ